MALTDLKIGNEVFLQGKYLSLGINGSGSLGTKQAAPTGVFTDITNGFNRVGLFADLDGFSVGKRSTVTEAMLDGTPTEGFTIGYKSRTPRSSRSIRSAPRAPTSLASAATVRPPTPPRAAGPGQPPRI